MRGEPWRQILDGDVRGEVDDEIMGGEHGNGVLDGRQVLDLWVDARAQDVPRESRRVTAVGLGSPTAPLPARCRFVFPGKDAVAQQG